MIELTVALRFGDSITREARNKKTDKAGRERRAHATNERRRLAYKNSPRIKALQRERKHRRKAIIIKATIGDNIKEAYEKIMQVRNCYWCGIDLSAKNIEVDHYIPLARGGEHSESNLVASCIKCNRSRGSKLPHEYKPTERHHEESH